MIGSRLPMPVVSRFKARSYKGDYRKAGDLAERIARDWLFDHPEVVEVDDLTRLPQIQRVDTDLVIYLADGTHPLAEIKWDRHLGQTGNILIEVLRLNHKAPQEVAGTLGWTLRTPAPWILYFAPRMAMFFQFKTELLRQAFQHYTDEMREKTQWVWISTDEVKSTVCILLPMRYCHGAFRVHDVEKYAERHMPEYMDVVRQARMDFGTEPLHW